MVNKCSLVIDNLLNEVQKSTKVEDGAAYIIDPVYGIVRNRVNAEVAKALVRTSDSNIAGLLYSYICRNQNKDGSWNEIHVNYNKPSALITSFIGDSLIAGYSFSPHDENLIKARDYVLSVEDRPGYFLKSETYNADHLNVDASCGAFLAEYGNKFSDDKCIEAGVRAAKNVCDHQTDGYYPYAADKGNYPYIFDIPCIHYQGVTMYYLAKIQEVIDEPWLKESLLNGAEWLSKVQNPDGSFDWSKSGLMFAYYLGGAAGFAYSSFDYVSKWDPKYKENALKSLDILESNIDGLVLRWEKDKFRSILPSFGSNIRTANLGNYPVSHRLFRYGYGMYRQVARRRFDTKVDDRVFSLLSGMMGINASTVEPFNNFPDMFMTSEVLDCLSWSNMGRDNS